MTGRTLTDAERIVSIREVIEAACGDWHEATALWSVQADINWLLERAEADEFYAFMLGLLSGHEDLQKAAIAEHLRLAASPEKDKG
jgi:hypothetical protein